jgi:hypothetical protein
MSRNERKRAPQLTEPSEDEDYGQPPPASLPSRKVAKIQDFDPDIVRRIIVLDNSNIVKDLIIENISIYSHLLRKVNRSLTAENLLSYPEFHSVFEPSTGERVAHWVAMANRLYAAETVFPKDGIQHRVTDKKGLTPVMWAARYNNHKIVAHLAAIDPGHLLIRDRKGRTALDIAVEYAQTESIAAILAKLDPKTLHTLFITTALRKTINALPISLIGNNIVHMFVKPAKSYGISLRTNIFFDETKGREYKEGEQAIRQLRIRPL